MSIINLGLDAGNNLAKTVGPYGVDKYRTALCGWFERDVVEKHGDDDMEFEIDGRKGFAGSIAEQEDEFGGGSMFGDSKAHEDVKIRALLAIYRYLRKYCPHENAVNIITGQPVATHKDSEKQKIKNMLQGSHTFTVNGEKQKIYIEGVEVATEGGGAFWSVPQMGLVHILDVGSGTVNAVTLKDKKVINNASDTFNFGSETILNKKDLEGMARGIIQNTTRLKWQKGETVLVCGGIAENIFPYLQKHYTDAQIIQPHYTHKGGVSIVQPVYANAVGFYTIANGIFR